jgi:hypothetical protein
MEDQHWLRTSIGRDTHLDGERRSHRESAVNADSLDKLVQEHLARMERSSVSVGSRAQTSAAARTQADIAAHVGRAEDGRRGPQQQEGDHRFHVG